MNQSVFGKVRDRSTCIVALISGHDVDFSRSYVSFVLSVSHIVFRFLLDDGALYLSDKVHAKEIDIKKSEISVILISINIYVLFLYVVCSYTQGDSDVISSYQLFSAILWGKLCKCLLF